MPNPTPPQGPEIKKTPETSGVASEVAKENEQYAITGLDINDKHFREKGKGAIDSGNNALDTYSKIK